MPNTYPDIELHRLEDIYGTYAENVPSAFEFAQAFFSQNQNGSTLYLRGKSPEESYQDVYLNGENNKYYFVSLGSKDIDQVLDFNTLITDELKLQFFSSDKDYSAQLKDRKIVYMYYNEGSPLPPEISCEGALNITDWITIEGDWKLQIDDEDVITLPTDILGIINYLNDNGFEVTIESDTPT